VARNFDNWLQAYMEYTRASESPDQFHVWTGISTIAGALRRRVWLDELQYQFTPNLYIILVGPPGVAAKSTSMRIGAKLLEKIKGPYIGPTVATWQKLAELMKEASETMKVNGKNGKSTEYLFAPVTFTVSELGSFFRLDDDSFVSFLIDLYDSYYSTKPWTYATKTSGTVEVMNPWINFIGCTTPEWLQNNYGERLIGGGLTSRIIFIFGDRKRQLVAYPSRHLRSADWQEHEAKLVADLQSIATMGGEMKLSEEAYLWGEEWYTAHHSRRPADMTSERFNGYLARKQAHLHKLAIICSASHHGSLIIEKKFLYQANQLLQMAELHMKHVFGSIGVVQEAKHSDAILSVIRYHEQITFEDLWRTCRNNMKRQDFDNSLNLCVQEGRVGKKQLGPLMYYFAMEKPEEPPGAKEPGDP